MASEELPDIASQVFRYDSPFYHSHSNPNRAIAEDDIPLLQIFIEEAGIKLSHLRDESGRNVLHRAVLAGSPEALKYFIKHGNLDIHEPTPTGKTVRELCKASLVPEEMRREMEEIIMGA